jgi:hypothetical protein
MKFNALPYVIDSYWVIDHNVIIYYDSGYQSPKVWALSF